MCTNEDKPMQYAASTLDERVRRQQAEAHAQAASGGIVSNAVLAGPKCIVAGCNNRFGEGVFHGELCSPCHRMITTGVVQPQGETFIHSMRRTLASAAEQSYMLRASKLLDADCHKSGRWPSVVAREHTLRVIIAALKQGEQDVEEGKREGR